MEAFYPLCKTGCIKSAMSEGHSDGWGVSGFNQKRVVYYQRRAADAGAEESLYKEAMRKLEAAPSPVVVTHFRKASKGSLSTANTHPFHSRDWCFAHNGTIFNPDVLVLGEVAPQGQTDSERFGYWLLDRVAHSPNVVEDLSAALVSAREQLKFSALNFLLSDGQALYAYREVSAKNLEADETIDDRRNYYTLYFGQGDGVGVICSEAIEVPGIAWQPIPQQTLVVISSANGTAQLIKV
jgi:predicted glutamine amidotransferase